MKSKINLIVIAILFKLTAFGQNYTSYFTGNINDKSHVADGGICLMGGASEDDNAMKWFLERSNGGDVLVLRASGSDGYNNYMFSELGVNVNSVETIVFNNSSAANELYIHQKIQQAEAIWFAGGDQWNYVSFWRDSPIDSLINDGIIKRNIVIGGTSAGMAIQGGFYFSAENGTVTSESALADPFDNNVTVDSQSFISNPYMSDVITDTHYDNPDRKGRHVVFLSRILLDYGIEAKGIACDEYTAVCIDTNGVAKVFGDYPTYDDNAYFIQTNCELSNNIPENCTPGNSLDWNLGNAAIKVYAIKGTSSGANTFNLKDWNTGSGGIWENWFVENGEFKQLTGTPINCVTLSTEEDNKIQSLMVCPNPSNEFVILKFNGSYAIPISIEFKNAYGQVAKTIKGPISSELNVNVSDLSRGLYLVEVRYMNKKNSVTKLIIK